MKAIILQSKEFASHGPFSAPASTSADSGSPELELTVKEVSDVRLLRGTDPSRVVAPAMPVSLVKPVNSIDAHTAPDQARESETWGIRAVGAVNNQYSGDGITVAVLDTGIERNHAAFVGLDLKEMDFTGEGNGDTDGHGTHCAGIIFGRSRSELANGARFGVAPGVKRALIGKILASGGGSTDAVCRAILWALDGGAQIISMSIAMDFPGYAKTLQEDLGYPPELAVSQALAGYRANMRLFDRMFSLIRARDRFGQGAIVLAAAGNESRRKENRDFVIDVAPPAAADNIVSVAAIERSKTAGFPYGVAGFSNGGAVVAAPGVDVLSADRNGSLSLKSGTSMATPHAAGVAALWAEKMQRETGRFKADEVIKRFTGTASLSPGLAAEDVGVGIVQAPQ